MSDHLTPLGGTCSARFDPLRELFAAKLASGEDPGASLAVNIHGEMVVDLSGGWADEARSVPWTENTISVTDSATVARARYAYTFAIAPLGHAATNSTPCAMAG
jgi:hypothetical protein